MILKYVMLQKCYNFCKKIVLIIFLFLFVYQCKEDDSTTPSDSNGVRTDTTDVVPEDTVYVSNELKSYYYFPIGSYWVYKRLDSISIYDTATVVRQSTQITFNKSYPSAWELVSVNIEHTYYSSSQNSSSPYLNVLISNFNGLVDRISFSSQDLFQGSMNCVLSIPIDSLSIREKSNACNSVSILVDTIPIQIDAGSFNNILHIEYGGSQITDEIWFAKNIGILKYNSFLNNHQWELISYHLN